jgi:hypothetical protein
LHLGYFTSKDILQGVVSRSLSALLQSKFQIPNLHFKKDEKGTIEKVSKAFLLLLQYSHETILNSLSYVFTCNVLLATLQTA